MEIASYDSPHKLSCWFNARLVVRSNFDKSNDFIFGEILRNHSDFSIEHMHFVLCVNNIWNLNVSYVEHTNCLYYVTVSYFLYQESHFLTTETGN